MESNLLPPGGLAVAGYWLLLDSFLLGIRHAFAIDHVACVSTVVESNQFNVLESLRASIKVGLGHAMGMVLVAAVGLVTLHGTLSTLPGHWVDLLTKVSGVWLISISVWMVLSLFRAKHHRQFWTSMYKGRWTPWLAGLVFGIAVSPGDLSIFTIVFTQSGNAELSSSLLVVFLAAMLMGMAAVGLFLGSVRGQRVLRVQRLLTALTGAFGLCVGLLLTTGLTA